MPELVNCRVCNHKISTSAKSCPNCGDFPSSITNILKEIFKIFINWTQQQPSEKEKYRRKKSIRKKKIFLMGFNLMSSALEKSH